MRLTNNLTSSRYEWAQQCMGKLISIAPSLNVADIGAKDGFMKALVESTDGHWQGFDLVPQSSDVMSWDLDNLPPDTCHKAGLVLMLDVLEHLRNPWNALQNLSRILLPNGFLILTVPNPRWSRSRTHALINGNLACFTQADLDLNHHVFTPWPHIVEYLLEDVGFTIESYVTLDGSTTLPGLPINLQYPLRFAYALLNMMIERYDPTARGMSYGVVARKKSSHEISESLL